MNQQGGYTLLEIGLVVAIVGIVTAVAIPSFNNTDSHKLDVAADEIARAIRFARDEAKRTGVAHGIQTISTDEQIRVYRLPVTTPIFDVRHPISKKLYDIQLNTDAHVSGVDLLSASYTFNGAATSSTSFDFSADGMPKTTSGGTDFMLNTGTITLSYGGQQKVISIAPMTGRVTLQ